MKVTTLDEASIRDIGQAFGCYDYGEEHGLIDAFPSRDAAAAFICGYVRMALQGGMLHTTSPRGEGDRLGIPVILETDARSKCDKYLHLGMKLAVRAGSVRTVCSTTSSDTRKQNKNRFPPAPALHDAGQAGFFCVFPAIGGSCMPRHV